MVYSYTCVKVILYPALSRRQQWNLYSFSQHYLVVLDSWGKQGENSCAGYTYSFYMCVGSVFLWTDEKCPFYLGWNCWWLWRVLSLCSWASWLWTFQALLCCWDGRSGSRFIVKFNGPIFTGMFIGVNESTEPFFPSCVKWNFCFEILHY